MSYGPRPLDGPESPRGTRKKDGFNYLSRYLLQKPTMMMMLLLSCWLLFQVRCRRNIETACYIERSCTIPVLRKIGSIACIDDSWPAALLTWTNLFFPHLSTSPPGSALRLLVGKKTPKTGCSRIQRMCRGILYLRLLFLFQACSVLLCRNLACCYGRLLSTLAGLCWLLPADVLLEILPP